MPIRSASPLGGSPNSSTHSTIFDRVSPSTKSSPRPESPRPSVAAHKRAVSESSRRFRGAFSRAQLIAPLSLWIALSSAGCVDLTPPWKVRIFDASEGAGGGGGGAGNGFTSDVASAGDPVVSAVDADEPAVDVPSWALSPPDAPFVDAQENPGTGGTTSVDASTSLDSEGASGVDARGTGGSPPGTGGHSGGNTGTAGSLGTGGGTTAGAGGASKGGASGTGGPPVGTGGRAPAVGGAGSGGTSGTGGVSGVGGSTTIATCAGVDSAGICWYLGDTGSSCVQVCASHGGLSPDAAAYVGSKAQGGSVEKCGQVLKLLGVSNSPSSATLPGGLGFGCCVYKSETWWLSSPDFSPTASMSGIQEVCGCSN